jgi:hypothetical protein
MIGIKDYCAVLIYNDFPDVELYTPSEIYVFVPRTGMWHRGRLQEPYLHYGIIMEDVVDLPEEDDVVLRLLMQELYSHNGKVVFGAITFSSGYFKPYIEKFGNTHIAFMSFIKESIRIEIFSSVEEFDRRYLESLQWYASFKPTKDVCHGYQFTRYFYDRLPKLNRDKIVDAVFNNELKIEDKIERVTYEYVNSVFGFIRLAGPNVVLSDMVVSLYTEIVLLLKGGIYKIDESLFPYLFSTDCELEWKYITFPNEVMVLDYGNTNVNMDVVDELDPDDPFWIGHDLSRVTPDEHYEFRGVLVSRLEDYLHLVLYGIEYTTNEEMYKFYNIRISDNQKPSDTLRDAEARVGRRMSKDVLNLVLSTVLYINLYPELAVHRKEYTELEKQILQTKKPKKMRSLEKRRSYVRNYIYIKPSSGVRRISNLPSGSGFGRKLNKLVSVRGHFRRQAHGPRMALRKTIWIEPHFRGLKYFTSESKDLKPYKVK